MDENLNEIDESRFGIAQIKEGSIGESANTLSDHDNSLMYQEEQKEQEFPTNAKRTSEVDIAIMDENQAAFKGIG